MLLNILLTVDIFMGYTFLIISLLKLCKLWQEPGNHLTQHATNFYEKFSHTRKHSVCLLYAEVLNKP